MCSMALSRTGMTFLAAVLCGPGLSMAQQRAARPGPLRLRPKAVLRHAEAPQAGTQPAPQPLPPDANAAPYGPIAPPYAFAPPYPYYVPYGYPQQAYPSPYGPYAPYGGGYGGYYNPNQPLGRQHHFTPYEAGRQTVRDRQLAIEARRAVAARRRQRRETGKDQVIERPGPYPFNPGPDDVAGAPYGASPGAYAPYGGGYGLGGYGQYDPYYYGQELETYRTETLAAREELTLMAYEDLLTQGVKSFRAGQYGAAARGFMAAAEKHQGDSGSRIHAAQALVAVGMYAEALVYVRRAVSLKPLLLFTPINLQADYGQKSDFDKHVAALAEHCRKNPKDTDMWLLLAFEQLLSPQPERCAEALSHVQHIVPYDRLAERLTRAAKPIIAAKK